MAKFSKSQNQRPQSMKFKAKPLKGPSFEVADFDVESDVCILSEDNQQSGNNSTSQSSGLSTSDLISVVGQIWDTASQSLVHFRPKADVHADDVCQKDNESCYLVRKDDILGPIEIKNLHVDLKSSSYFHHMVQQSLECLKLTQEISYKPCDDQFVQSFSLKDERNSSFKHDVYSNGKGFRNVQRPYHLMDSYRWMRQISSLPELRTSASVESKKIIETTSESTVCASCPLSGNDSLSNHPGTGSLEPCNDMPNSRNLSSGANVIVSKQAPLSSLYSDYFLQAVEDTRDAVNMSTCSSLGLKGSNYVSISDPGSTFESNRHKEEEEDLLENKKTQFEKLDPQDGFQSEGCSSVINKPHPLLAKQEHAVSGALAGIFVSLCLHPIDTIKTVVQSCQAGQTSVRYIGQSIISERGITGLYRGISSNITTSAPISAIYTFTYESVKGFLVPSLSKEYHSVAHCTAGACASIATSFIFTPSERIKQQMQVNSQYKNCWSAVYKIIEKGGLSSLYAGWGAVLCRNIPHSIIKFYTYESLKQMLLSSQPTGQLNTLQTLLCGGLAGSTAALFSTPFDVVKTRLQTQMPGSKRRYNSGLHVFQEIREHEGFKGLYRGLIPRLVMYMSQGALFFASYELFKSLFSVQIQQHKPEILQYKQDTDDDPLFSL